MRRFRSKRRPGNIPMTGEVLDMVMRAKEGPCVACWVRHNQGLLAWERVSHQNDWNHCKSGNIRRGHEHGFALCVWHHRAHPLINGSPLITMQVYGLSLMNGGKAFAAAYGTDDYLIDLQQKILKGEV